MTLATIIRSVLRPSSARYYEYPTVGQSQKFFSDKNDGSDYYHYGSSKKSKGKSKSEKKHAILSALTLLAFLFFLNILQSCIREQNQTRSTMMMFAPTAPTAQQSKEPEAAQEPSPDENHFRKTRSTWNSTSEKRKEEPEKEAGKIRKSRSLLGISPSFETSTNSNRQLKFIHNFQNVNNWTKELSQVSDKDLQDQKLKTLNFPLYWKNNRFATQHNPQVSTKMNKVTEIPVLHGESVPPLLRRLKKRERTTIRTDMAKNETTGVPSFKINSQKLTWNQRNHTPQNLYKSSSFNFSDSQNSPTAWKGFSKAKTERQSSTWSTEETTNVLQYPKSTATTANVLSVGGHVATTPRSRRSEYSSTPRSVDYDEFETREDYQVSVTPAVGLDLNTYQTYPVYNYYNHRTNPYHYRENDTTNSIAPEHSANTEISEIDRMHNEVVKVATEPPLFYPTKMSPSFYKPYYEKTKYRKRRPEYHNHHHSNHYSSESRYRYSPYRKNGGYEPTHFHDPLHDDYHIVLARYPQDEEPGFDFIKFFWTMFTSFAKPLTKLVPGFAKESNEEPQCYDLLVCEAQRVSKFMGPTAEALTTTLGTILTWAAPEETRQVVVDALNSGRENTCQQQIRDCEDRSGGKSAMTVIAQVMEMKLR